MLLAVIKMKLALYVLNLDRIISVGIETHYGLESQGIESR
jgi:hypothetical protein